MRARGTGFSRSVAVVVALIVIFALMFSTVAYFVSNGNGGSIVGGGVVENPVDNAENYDMNNATVIDNSSTYLKSNGATVNSNGTVTYNTNNKRNGVAASSQTDASNSGDDSWSFYPTKYIQLPEFGAYNLTNVIANAGHEDINNRAMGLEIYNKSGRDVLISNSSNRLQFAVGNTRNTHHWVAAYFTIALPGNMVPKSSNVQFDLQFDAYFNTNNRYGALAYAVFAETGEVGVNARLTGNPNASNGSIGFQHGHNLINDNLVKYIADGQVGLETDINKVFGGNTSTYNSSKTVSGSYTLPAGTKYIRIVLAMDAFSSSNLRGKNVEADISNFKVKISDNSQLDLKSVKADAGQESQWLNAKYADYYLGISNNYGFNRDNALSQATITAQNPLTGATETYNYNNLPREGTPQAANSMVALATSQPNIETTYTAVNLDGTVNSSAKATGRGLYFRLLVRTGMVTVELNYADRGINGIIDGTQEAFIVPRVDSFADGSKFNADIPIKLVREGNNISVNLSGQLSDGSNAKGHASPEKAYYVVKNKGEALNQGDYGSAKEFTGLSQGGSVNEIREIEGLSHGQYDIYILIKDDCGNVAVVSGLESGIPVAIDGSDINNGTLTGTVVRPDGKSAQDWINGDITLNLTYTVTGDQSVTAGIYIDIIVIDKTGQASEKTIRLDNVTSSNGENKVFTGSYTFNANSYSDISVKAINKIDGDTETVDDDVYKSGTIDGAETYTLRIDKAGANYTIEGTSNDFPSSLTTDFNDSAWWSGMKKYRIRMKDANYTSLFDEQAGIKVEYCLDTSLEELVWIEYEVKFNTNQLMGKERYFEFYLGEGEADPSCYPITTDGSNNAGNVVKSTGNRLAFRITMPNGDMAYYNCTSGTVMKDYSYEATHQVKLDNVVPEFSVVAMYNHDVATIDELFFSNEGSKNVESDKWFYGNFGAKLVIANYKDILSRDDIGLRDYYLGEDADRIYKKVSESYDEVSGSMTYYITFDGITNYVRNLGFEVTTGSGIKVAANNKGIIGTAEEVIMKYDNNVPTIDYKVNGETVSDEGKWHNSDVTIDITKGAYPEDASNVTYTLEYLDENGSQEMIMLDQDTYQVIVNNNTDAIGRYYNVYATNEAGRQVSVKYTVKVDKDKDIIGIEEWTKSKDGINYVTDAENNFAHSVNVGTELSPVKYYYYLSDTKLNKGDVEGLDLSSATVMEINDGQLKIKFDGNIGKKYIYFISKDEAGNIAVHNDTAEDLVIVVDGRDYVITLEKNGKGKFEYSYTNNDGSSDVIKGEETSISVKVGTEITFTATEEVGSKFLGFYENTPGSDNPDALNTMSVIIAYNDGAAYKYGAVFKIIVKDIDVINNIQGSGSIIKPYGTANVENASINFSMNEGGNNVEDVEYTYIDYLKVEYLINGEWTTELPSELGSYQYRITVSDTTHWMQESFVATIVIADGDVINIVFDKANENKEYVYNNTIFISNNSANIGESEFIKSYEKYFDVRNINNEDMTSELIEALKTGLIGYTVEIKGQGAQDNYDVKNVGTYVFSIKNEGQDGALDITKYDIDFTVEFKVTPRPLTLEMKDDVVTKQYDGTVTVVDVIDDWGTYFDTSVANIADGENINGIGLKFTSFEFSDFNAGNVEAQLKGVTLDESSNYVIANPEETYTFNGKITPAELALKYSGKNYSKIYDGNVNVDKRAFSTLGVLGRELSEIDYYWATAVLFNDDVLTLDFKNIVLDDANVGARSITVSVEDAILLDENGDVSRNYIVSSIDTIDNAEITRKEVTIDVMAGSTVKKQFDASRFAMRFTYDGLIAKDNTLNEFGIPEIFENAVQYTNLKDESVYMNGTESYPWNIGKYTVKFGNKDAADDGFGYVALGDNYKVLAANLFNYEIVAKELKIVVSPVISGDDMFSGQFVNAKYYDGKPVKGEIKYTNKANIFNDGKNEITFAVSDNRGESYEMIEGYSINFVLSVDNINAGKRAITSPSEIRVEFNGEATDNYNVEFIKENLEYEILRRPLVVDPTLKSVEYSAGVKNVRISVNNFRNDGTGDFMLHDYFVTEGGERVSTEISDKDIIKALEEHMFNMLLEMVDKEGKAVVDANVSVSGAYYDESVKYMWSLLNTESSMTNFIFMSSPVDDIKIMQAEYFIFFEGNYFNSSYVYNDETGVNSLPSINNIVDSYDIKNKQGENTNINLDGLALAYYYINAEDGTLLDKVTEGNYGVGKYVVKVETLPELNNNYTITNIKDGTNELNTVSTGEGGILEVNPDGVYGFEVTPIVINVALSKNTSLIYKSKTMAEMAANAYNISYTSGKVTSQEILDKLDPTKMTEGGATFVRVNEGSTEDVAYVADNYLDVSNYRVDYTRVDLGNNYKIVIVNGNEVIAVNPIRIYVKFSDAERTKVYDGKSYSIVKTEFVDAYGNSVDMSELADRQFKVQFDAKTGAGIAAVNADGAYYLTFAPEGEGSATVISTSDNYLFDGNEPLAPISGNSNAFTITKRPVNIDMVRKDGITDMNAIYGHKYGTENMEFRLYDSFGYRIQTETDGAGALAGEIEQFEAIMNNVKYSYSLTENGVESNKYTINFMNINGLTSLTNYNIKINNVKDFELYKAVIKVSLDTDNINIPEGSTYGTIIFDENSFKMKFVLTMNDDDSGNDVNITDNIGDYLTKTSEIILNEGEATEDGVKYSLYIKNDNNMDFIFVDNAEGLKYAQAYRIVVEHDKDHAYSFTLKKKDITINFLINAGIAPIEGVYEYGMAYTLGDTPYEFNPNNIINDGKVFNADSPYMFSNEGIVEGDELIITDVIIDNMTVLDNGNISYKVTLKYSLTHAEFYNIKHGSEAAVSNEIVISYELKKKDAKVNLENKGEGNIVYGDKFLNNFNVTISLAGFDAIYEDKFQIDINNMKLENPQYIDEMRGKATIKVTGISIDEEIRRYYNVPDSEGLDVEFEKAPLNINILGGYYNKTFDTANITDDNAFVEATLSGIISANDNQYIFATENTDVKGNYIRFVGSDGNYAINTLNAGVYTDGAESFVLSDYMVYNEGLLKNDNPLYRYVLNFGVNIAPCEISVEIDEASMTDFIKEDGKLHYEYGYSIESIFNTLKVTVRRADGSLIDGELAGIVLMSLANSNGSAVFDAGMSQRIDVTFALNDVQVGDITYYANNYSLKKDKDNTVVVIDKKTLYYDFNNNSSEDKKVLVQSVYGDVSTASDEKQFLYNSIVGNPDIDIVLFDGDVMVAMPEFVYSFKKNGSSFNADKYELEVSVSDTNYQLSPYNGVKNYYVITPVELNTVKGRSNAVSYGITYGDIASVYDYKITEDDAVFRTNLSNWDNLSELVRKEIRKYLAMAIYNESGEAIGADTVRIDSGKYSVKYVSESKNIIVNDEGVSYTITPVNVNDIITNEDVHVTYTGEEITVTITGNSPLISDYAKEFVVEKSDIINVGEYPVKVTAVDNKNFIGSKEFTVTVDKKQYVANASYQNEVSDVEYLDDITAIKTPLNYDESKEKYTFTITFNGEPVDSLDNVNANAVGKYEISVSVLPKVENAENNYIPATIKTVINVGKKNVDMKVNSDLLSQIYGEVKDVTLADTSVPVSEYTVTYRDSEGRIVDDIKKAPQGKYTVEIAMNEESNYRGNKAVMTMFINAKDITSVLDGLKLQEKTDSGIEDIKFENGVYKIFFAFEGHTLTLGNLEELIGENYYGSVKGISINVTRKGGDSVIFNANEFTVKEAGEYTVTVSFTTDDNIILGSKSISLNVYKLLPDTSTEDNAFNHVTIESDEENGVFIYDGNEIELALSYNGIALKYDAAKYELFIPDEESTLNDEPSGQWEVYVGTPREAGRYRVTVHFMDNDYEGNMTYEFVINPVTTTFEFTSDLESMKEFGYGTEYEFTFSGDNSWAVELVYYNSDGVRLEGKPADAGSYTVKAEIAPQHKASCSFSETEGVVFEHSYTITKIDIPEGTIEITGGLYEASKDYDGKNVKLEPDMSKFIGLPENSSVTLEYYNGSTKVRNMVNGGTYTIKAVISGGNYNNYVLTYGTYTINKADIKTEAEKKTEDSITIAEYDYGMNVTVYYSIDGGEFTEKNVFKDLESNTTYTIRVKVVDESGVDITKNFNSEMVEFEVTTNPSDKLSTKQIIIIGGCGGLFGIFLIALVIILIVRKRRTV